MQRLDLLCATKKSIASEVLRYVLLTKEWTVATDGHAIVAHNTKRLFYHLNNSFDDFLDENDRFLIPADQWKKICQSKVKSCYLDKQQKSIVTKNGYDETLDIIPLKTEEDVDKYPKWENVFPQTVCKKGEGAYMLGIDPLLLHNLQQAIYPDYKKSTPFPLYLQFTNINIDGLTESALIVKSREAIYENKYFKALIMPFMIPDELK